MGFEGRYTPVRRKVKSDDFPLMVRNIARILEIDYDQFMSDIRLFNNAINSALQGRFRITMLLDYRDLVPLCHLFEAAFIRLNPELQKVSQSYLTFAILTIIYALERLETYNIYTGPLAKALKVPPKAFNALVINITISCSREIKRAFCDEALIKLVSTRVCMPYVFE